VSGIILSPIVLFFMFSVPQPLGGKSGVCLYSRKFGQNLYNTPTQIGKTLYNSTEQLSKLYNTYNKSRVLSNIFS